MGGGRGWNLPFRCHIGFGFRELEPFLSVMGFRTHYPQNTAPWHVEHFQRMEFEKSHVGEGLSYLPLKQVIRPLCKRCPPLTQGKEHPELQGRGELRGAPMHRPCQVSCLLHLVYYTLCLSYFSIIFPTSSNLV